MKRVILVLLIVVGLMPTAASAAPDPTIGINVLLSRPLSDSILQDIGKYGKVLDVLEPINALTMRVKESDLFTIRYLPYVRSAAPDAERSAIPIHPTAVTDFAAGLSTWNLDAIDVTDFAVDPPRTVDYDGEGVYVAVLDTGLVNDWPAYFPAERIATEYAIAFGGGGGEKGNVSTQPGKWGRDTNSHGTHVTSTILGYRLGTTPINGVAPMAKVIPVKVLNQSGSGWSSMVAQGITYVAELKAPGGPLEGAPVVINMSLGGPVLEPVEKAAIDYAIEQGVIIVASAGNEGEAGMGYPGAYGPVISVAAAGWVGEWKAAGWWTANVADPTDPEDFYITDFSSRAVGTQQLDVAAPGSWVVGPYQTNMGQTSYYYLGGTSMASPHVAGIVALMLDKNPGLTSGDVADKLQTSAIDMPTGCRDVMQPSGVEQEFCWDHTGSGYGLVNAPDALAAVSLP